MSNPDSQLDPNAFEFTDEQILEALGIALAELGDPQMPPQTVTFTLQDGTQVTSLDDILNMNEAESYLMQISLKDNLPTTSALRSALSGVLKDKASTPEDDEVIKNEIEEGESFDYVSLYTSIVFFLGKVFKKFLKEPESYFFYGAKPILDEEEGELQDQFSIESATEALVAGNMSDESELEEYERDDVEPGVVLVLILEGDSKDSIVPLAVIYPQKVINAGNMPKPFSVPVAFNDIVVITKSKAVLASVWSYVNAGAPLVKV